MYGKLPLVAFATAAILAVPTGVDADERAASPAESRAVSGLMLDLSGRCPGPVTVSVTGATPYGDITIAGASGQGGYVVPHGRCEGVEVDLESPFRLARVRADGMGSFETTPYLDERQCSVFAQAVDMTTCDTTATTTARALDGCVETMDDACPDAAPACGATFDGGESCVIDFLGNCYDSGTFAYRVDPAQVGTVELDGDLIRLDVFFAAAGNDAGELRFFDALGVAVDAPVTTNGDCLLAMPPTQQLEFSRPVRSIEIRATGANQVYLDTFQVNPG